MEQPQNRQDEGATDALSLPAVRVSDRLTPSLIEAALEASPHRHPGRAQRKDGWTPERIRLFLTALAECGVVADAARAAGMSPKSAYNLRNRTANRAFHLAWSAAEQLARRRLSADLLSRAIHGCVELIVRDGEVWAERHRYDNRLTMAVQTRLDRQAAARDSESRTVRIVAQEFDQFLDIVCDEGRGAARFIAARQDDDDDPRDEPDAYGPRELHDAELLERAENYARCGAGLASEIPVADLDPEQQASWTEEQRERAHRSGLAGERGAAPGMKRRGRITEIRRIMVRPSDPDYGADPVGGQAAASAVGAAAPAGPERAAERETGDEWQP